MTRPPASSAAALRAGGTNEDPGWVRGAPRGGEMPGVFPGGRAVLCGGTRTFYNKPIYFFRVFGSVL